MNEDFEIPIGELPLLNPDPFSVAEHTKLDREIHPDENLKLHKSNLFAQVFIVQSVMQSAAAARPELQRCPANNNFTLDLLKKNESFAETVELAIERRSFAAIRSSGE